MDTVSRSEALRTAWGLVIANLRMRAQGPGAVTSEDIEALAGVLRSPQAWGLVAAALAGIAADCFCDLQGGTDAALAEARETALDLAARGG